MRAIRTERGLTQERLALETGLNRHTVYRIELGTHAGSVDAVLLIAAALGVPPARLFQDE